jgi:3-phenylpropionate/trans-cinnamate dioxygenase ferredoxin reductase subunit
MNLSNSTGMVIIGAGYAGAQAAIELRTQGWKGSITLIGQEELLPYERPPLSKALLKESDKPSPAFILNEQRVKEYQLELMSKSTVTKIDRFNHLVHLLDGREFRYERLLLTLGAYPRKLNLEDSDTSGALYLRTFSDALQIRSCLLPGQHIVIVGGGFIGLEVAASARERGCTVTIIEVAPRILMRGVPAELAALLEARHRAAGVKFKIGVGIKRIESSPAGHTIIMADGDIFKCAAYIVGIGAIPEIALATSCGLAIGNGIRADHNLATSDQDIFAAGDCCSFPHPIFGGRRIRLEAWSNAQEQGLHVARSMLGICEAYQEVPWFWSDQYEMTLQIAGMPDMGAVCIKRPGLEENQLYFHFTEEGRLVGASGIGPAISKDIRYAQLLIAQRLTMSPITFSSPDLKLKSLLSREN